MPAPAETPSEAADLAEQVMDHVMERRATAAARKTRRPAWKTRERNVRAALAAALPILALLVIPTVTGRPLRAYFESSPSAVVALQQARDAVGSMVADLAAFIEDYDALPDSLAEIGVPLDGEWTYNPIDAGSYTIALKWHGQIASFDSTRGGHAVAPPLFESRSPPE